MKRHASARMLLLMVMALTLLFGAMRIQAQAPAALDGREADHAALRELRNKVAQAINDQDMDSLATCLTRPFVFTTVDQSVLTTEEELKAYYDRMLREPDSPVTDYRMAPAATVPTLFIDGNTGYCYGTSDDVYTLRRNGRDVPMTCHWTATMVKENGAWKIAAVHTGVNVMDNPVIDTRVAAMKTTVVIAAVVALLVGIVLGYLVKRRKARA